MRRITVLRWEISPIRCAKFRPTKNARSETPGVMMLIGLRSSGKKAFFRSEGNQLDVRISPKAAAQAFAYTIDAAN